MSDQITVMDTSNVAYPAGFGYRVDAVPEMSTWLMMALGFASLGFAGYRGVGRRQSADLSA